MAGGGGSVVETNSENEKNRPENKIIGDVKECDRVKKSKFWKSTSEI